MSPIISPSELKRLPTENLVLLDARVGKDVYRNYLEKHIKGARFIDLDKDLAEIGENAAFGGRHPLPDIKKFAQKLSELGISEKSHIVIYDDKNGANAAARAWWMLKAFGIEPKIKAIRGGTDGAQLSYMGLPCPNIFAGGINFHGPYEYVALESMQKAMEVILNIVKA
jgi:thiosulfate/3-mercaptopyruvate sulfurtransferase